MDHLRQIQQAVDYIEASLKADLEIENIAKRAGYSHWHFQRLFSATVGEGVMEYVRKRRLTGALKELTSSDKRIIEIALDYGFESQESFTRAFKTRFGLNPGEARSAGMTTAFSLEKAKITMDYLDHLYRGMNMQPKIIEREAFKVIGMGAPFISILSPEKNNFVVIPALWGRYVPRCAEITERKSWADIGLIYCMEGKGQCYYVAGTEVKSAEKVPEGMEVREVPAGRYAVFTHKGALDKLEHTMSYIYGSWLPKSGMQFREAPDIEIYDQRFKPGSDDSEMDICIPVA